MDEGTLNLNNVLVIVPYVLDLVLERLPLVEAHACGQVCRSWRAAINGSAALWQRLVVRTPDCRDEAALAQLLDCLRLRCPLAAQVEVIMEYAPVDNPATLSAVAALLSPARLADLTLRCIDASNGDEGAALDLGCLAPLTALTRLSLDRFAGWSCASLPELPCLRELRVVFLDHLDELPDFSQLPRQPLLAALRVTAHWPLDINHVQWAALSRCAGLTRLQLSCARAEEAEDCTAAAAALDTLAGRCMEELCIGFQGRLPAGLLRHQ